MFINFKLLDLIDAIRDYIITGNVLVKTVPSPSFDYSKNIGMTPSQPARYFILEKVFSHVELNSNDAFIDVGCGKGRVLAYLHSIHCPCPLYGIELSRIPGEIALEWTNKHDEIKAQSQNLWDLGFRT